MSATASSLDLQLNIPIASVSSHAELSGAAEDILGIMAGVSEPIAHGSSMPGASTIASLVPASSVLPILDAESGSSVSPALSLPIAPSPPS